MLAEGLVGTPTCTTSLQAPPPDSFSGVSLIFFADHFPWGPLIRHTDELRLKPFLQDPGAPRMQGIYMDVPVSQHLEISMTTKESSNILEQLGSWSLRTHR